MHADATHEQTKRIPAHILYPGLVFLMLTGSVAAQMVLLGAALSGDGPQVEGDYYQRALSWDEDKAARDLMAHLGWSVEVTPVTHLKRGQVELLLQCVDQHGEPLSGLEGMVTAQHVSLVKVLAKKPLARVPHQPGTYRIMVSSTKLGLWDVHIEMAQAHGALVRHVHRIEVK